MKTVLLPAALIASLAASFNVSSLFSHKVTLQPVTLSLPAAAEDMVVASAPKGTRSYTYEFSGNALCDGQACSNTLIDLRVYSGDTAQRLQARADANGRFTVAATVQSKPNGIVKWEIIGQTHSGRGSIEGHQIPLDESHIQVEAPLQLASL